MRDRAAIVAACRLSTVENVKRTIEEGAHDGLIERDGRCAVLYDTRSRRRSLAPSVARMEVAL